MKPQTFMNNSGEAIGEAAKFYKIPPQNIIVLSDDISLDVGKIRIRRKGSAGGHNGLKSIIAHLGSEDFPRVKSEWAKSRMLIWIWRIGCSADFPRSLSRSLKRLLKIPMAQYRLSCRINLTVQ